jgi:hypothetical protein
MFETDLGGLSWQGTLIGGEPVSSSAALLWGNAPPNSADPSNYFETYDDFMQQASATASDYTTWTSMDDGATGTNAFQDVSGGVYNIVTAAAQDDYHGIRSVAKSFLPVAGKPIWFEARFKVAEAATNKSAWIFGLMGTVTTGGLQTGTSGPLASYDGIVLWKDEASMAINFETSKAGTQATATGLATSVTDTWTRVGFYMDGTATTANVIPYTDIGAGWVQGTTKTLTLSGLGQMYLIGTVKAGAGGAAETLQLDYIKCRQLR